MIRLRFGQTWRREGTQAVDSVALTLHGMDILVGANEESLPDVVDAWSTAWQSVGSEAGDLGQVSLPEARLELVMRRVTGSASAIELQVASLGRPARVTRSPVQVDAFDLRKAWVAGVSALWRDLQEGGDEAVAERVLGALERVRQVSPPFPARTSIGPGYGYRCFAREDFQMGFELWDAEERLLAHRSGGNAALASLLVPGRVSLRTPEQVVQYAPESIFLFALETSRQAQELLDTNGSRPNTIELAGTGPSLPLGDASAGPPALLPALFRFGLELAFAIEARNTAHRENPYLRELVDRCQAGLRALRLPVPLSPATPETSIDRKPRAPPAIDESGKLRRLKFVERYQARVGSPENVVQLVPVPKGGVWVSAPQWAERYDAHGKEILRLASDHGVAVSASDMAILSEGNRLLGFDHGRPGARWLQPHDGLPLGPWLLREGPLYFTQSETRAAVAYWAASGREAWRFAPFRNARVLVAIFGGRALIASDAGDLFGLSSADGQLRYRFEAPLPFLAPPVALGKSFVAVLGSGDHSALVCADAETGTLRWTRELPWSRASAPIVAGGRVWLAGHRGADGRLTCVTPDGEQRFDIALPFADDAYLLLSLGRSVLVAGPHGAAARISPKGKVEYQIPPSTEPAWRKLGPRVTRGVVFLPGHPLRAIDARTGRLLAELRGGPALLSYETDRHLGVYTLDEDGTLKAFRLTSHFAVVD